MGYLSRNAHREFRPVEPGVYYRADLGVTADVFSVKELGYGEGRRVYFTWKADNGNSGLSHLPESTFAQVYVRVDESDNPQSPTSSDGESLPPAADPGDVPSETTRRYQAEGLAALTAALDLNGPLAPVPYLAATDAAPACSVCGDPGRPVDDGTGEPYALCDAGDEAHLSVRETLPVSPAAPALTSDQVRLLRQADRGDLYLGRETGVWFRRSELGRFLVKARPADAAELHTRGLITATRPVPNTRWLAGELTDAGRSLLASTTTEPLAA